MPGSHGEDGETDLLDTAPCPSPPMLALCCRSRQVVMANEELHGPDMVGELLGKRQRRAYQTRHALAQRVVEPCDVIGFARYLADRFVLRGRNHLLIYDILLRVKCGVVTVST